MQVNVFVDDYCITSMNDEIWRRAILNKHRWAVTSFPCHTTRRTGPYRAVRRVKLSADSQFWNSERVEVSIGQRLGECRAVR